MANPSTKKSRNPWWEVLDVLRIYWALLLGNVLEWYEYAVFSFLEPYFQSHFFHGNAVSTWLGFAVTFVARPFGGLVLGVVGDIFGRKVSTFLSIFGMMVGTVGQGLLPTYRHGELAGSIGLALLVILRLLQGICTGGEIASVTTYITEVGAKDSLCRSMMLVGITCNVGFLLAQSASYGMELLGEENMESWGWRVPFVVAIIPGTIATLGRRCMPESKDFLEGRAREHAIEESEASESQVSDPGAAREACGKMWQLIGSHWRALVVGVGSVTAVSVLQYGGFIWCSVLLKKQGTEPAAMLAAGVTARIFSIVLAPGVALMADKQGVAWTTFLGAAMLTLLGMPLFMAMATNFQSFEAVVGSYGLGFGFIFAFVGMVFFVLVCELFPVEIRNAGVGLSYNIGFCCFGGFAPMIFEAASEHHFWAPGWLLSLAGLTSSTVILVGLWWQRRGTLELTHIRPEPYFSPCGVSGQGSRGEKAPAHVEI